MDSSNIPDKLFGPSQPTDKPVIVENHPDNLPTTELYDKSTVVNHVSSASLSDNMLVASPLSLPVTSPVMTAVSNSMDPFLHARDSMDDSLEDVHNGASVSDVVTEVDIQTTPDVLDISDPFQLFKLISDGSVVVQPVFEENRNELVIKNNTSSPFDSLVAKENNTGKDESIDSKVESFFIPPVAKFPTKSESSKSITHHRLLTSEDVIKEKLKIETLKAEGKEETSQSRHKNKA